jgi:hypothetical protein
VVFESVDRRCSTTSVHTSVAAGSDWSVTRAWRHAIPRERRS